MFFFFQAEDGIRDAQESRGLGDVYKRQPLGCAYAKLGETEKALECIRKIEQRQVEEPESVLDIDLAMIWWSLKEKDKAIFHLFQCVEKKMGVVAILIDHPM